MPGDPPGPAGEKDTARQRQQLQQLVQTLEELHRLLIELARRDYETAHGTVGAVQLLQLLVGDPFFAWMRPLSALIASVSELLDERQAGVSRGEVVGIVTALDELFTLPPGVGDAPPPGRYFASRYLALLQESPEVAIAHARVRQTLHLMPRPVSAN
jgi:hypothetical protein